MKKIITFALLTLSFFTIQAQAKTPSFTYVEGKYVANGKLDVSRDGFSADVDTDGYAITGSLELGIFVLQATRIELDSDTFLGSKFEDTISIVSGGLAFELPFSQVYALVRARRDDLKLRSPFIDAEDERGHSVGLEIGGRVNLTDNFEVNANFGTVGDGNGDAYGIGAQYLITGNLGVVLDIQKMEVEEGGIEADFTTTSLGLRFSF